MVLTARTYEEIALADIERKWEMHDGVLSEKLPMAIEHNTLAQRLFIDLYRQLDPRQFHVSINFGRTRRSDSRVYIPDVMVVSYDAARALIGRPLEIYDEPAKLVVEVQSPSTERIDFRDKLPAYQARGDQEIWLVHPHELWARVWVREAAGSYGYEEYSEHDTISLTSLPGVTILLGDLRMPD